MFGGIKLGKIRSKIQLPKRKLGKTGVEVPCLALGSIFNTDEHPEVLEKAIELGVTYWPHVKIVLVIRYFVHNGISQQRYHYLVMSCDSISLSACVRGSFDYVLPGSVMLDHVEIGGGKLHHVMSQIPG